MKRFVSKMIIAAVLTVFACNSIFAASAKVTYVKGKVEVNRGKEWVSLKVGDSVNESETISTGFQSEARLNFNGSVMAVPALSRITLETLQSSGTKETVSLKVDTGAVRSKVTHEAGKRMEYTAHTAVAVASVRGTDFAVFSNGKAKVFSGAIAYYKISDFVAPLLASTGSEDGSSSGSDGETSDAEGASAGDSAAGAAAGGTSAGGAPAGGSDTKAPASQAPATANTAANNIISNAPKGTMVVGAGQSSTISKAGIASKPLVEAKKKATKAKTTVASAATKEVLSASLASAAAAVSADVVVSDDEKNVSVPKTTGSVNVTIKISESSAEENQ